MHNKHAQNKEKQTSKGENPVRLTIWEALEQRLRLLARSKNRKASKWGKNIILSFYKLYGFQEINSIYRSTLQPTSQQILITKVNQGAMSIAFVVEILFERKMKYV